MKRLIGATVALMITASMATAAWAADATYVGAAKCKVCHLAQKQGAQFTIWQGTTHAKAFATLATPEAKAAAQKAGVTGDPQKSDKCLKCHTPSVSVKPALVAADYDVTLGVQCESCHGPGSEHLANMKERIKTKNTSIPLAITKGDQKLCVTCHNSESPNYKPFKYDEFWAKIKHPLPKS